MSGSRSFSYVPVSLAVFAYLAGAPAWSGLDGAELPDRAAASREDAAEPTKAGANEGLRQAFERAIYSLKDSGQGSLRGKNRAQRLTLEFDGSQARLSHPDGSVAFHLTGYGYGDRLRVPAHAVPISDGNRVEYRRGELTEWYWNTWRGVEQGFTLARRPPADRRYDKPLVIAIGVSGELKPFQGANADAVLFKSGKGVVLRYAGLKASDARGRFLPSRIEVRSGEIRLIVEDRGAEYPLVVDPIWTQQQEMTASDGATGYYFGSSVAVSGDTAIIGAPHSGSVGGANGAGPGAAYVFVRNGSGAWTQVQELTASDGVVGDGFGAQVAMSGSTAMIVGQGKSGLGAVYVFVRNGSGTWTQVQELTASDGVAGDHFGGSLSVSGSTAVVGAPFKNSYQGAAYVFARNPSGTWSQQQELTAADGVAGSSSTGDYFGWSVSVSGNTAVVGAWQKDNSQGAAYVFVGDSSGTWVQRQKLIALDGTWGDMFGTSVSISGPTVVIGAPGGNLGEGVAYVFVRNGTSWSELPVDLDQSDMAAGDNFGASVSVSGNTAVISAPGKASEKGSAYIFARPGGSVEWSQVQELTASDGASGDYFGNSVSGDGTTALIGAPTKNTYQGASYAFAGPGTALVFGSAADSSSVAVNYSGSWTATANDSFLHISAGSATGTGSGVVAFTYDAFTGTGSRTGTLTVAGLTVAVTQAGTNYAGPGGVATVSSGLNGPSGVAVDVAGNLYSSGTSNNAIQEWNALTQQVATLVSTGLSSPSGVAVDGIGNVYFSDSGNNAIKEWNAATLQVATLVSTGLSNPSGVAVDASLGNVYFSDSGNNAIKEWSASTQQVTTLVSSGLSHPSGLALDRAGNLYFADSGNNAIKKWTASTQQVTTLVSTGLSNPLGVGVDGSSGNVYFADTGNNAIKEWSASTKQVTTLLSSGLNAPSGVAVDNSGNVYIANAGKNEIVGIFSACVGPTTITEPASAASDVLFPVLPPTVTPQPTSDQSWLSIGSITNGAISFSFTANTSASARVAHIAILGQQITVTQNPASNVTFSASPNPIPAGNTTTLSWNAPGYSQLAVLVGSSSGISLANPVGPSGSVTTGNWVTDGMEFFLVDLKSGSTIAIVTVHLSSSGGTAPSGVTFTANPNPIPEPGQPTTLTWNAPGYSNLVIHVNSATGTALTGTVGSSGSAATGTWVTNGMTFFLVDKTSGATVASVVVNVGPAVPEVQPPGKVGAMLTASPNPSPAAGDPVTLTWNAPEYQYVAIRLYSPTGPALTGIAGSSGSAYTGNWLNSDTQFFLVDLASGATIASLWVYVGHEFIATPNPIPVSGQPTTLTWNAPGYSKLAIHLNSPTGPDLTGTVGSTGSAATGTWATDGMQFFLVDVTSGATVASLVVHVGVTYSSFPVAADDAWCIMGSAPGPACASTPAGATQAPEVAAPFTPSATGSLLSLNLALHYESGTNGAVISLLRDSGGVPGSVLESWTVMNLPTGVPPAPTTVTDTQGVRLEAGQQYWVAVQPLGADTLVWWSWNSQGLAGGMANNGLYWQPLNSGEGLPAFSVTEALHSGPWRLP